ncbi:MAG: GWxTD domain-containing protein [Bacteroidota bacterium]
MKKLYLVLFLLFPALLHAQNGMGFDFDFARFGYDSLSNFVEFYYSFRQDNLKLEKRGKDLYVNAKLHIEIQDTVSGNFLVNKNWKIDNIADTASARQGKSLIGVIGFVIPKGTYRCTITGSDGADTTKRRVIKETFTIDPFLEKNLALSDVELATSIKQESADTQSIFYKNTLEVVPNPLMVFGEGSPVLYYYTEIYNLKNPSIKSENVSVRTILYNSKGTKISEKTKQISKISNSRVEVGTVNITKYPTDAYTLMINLVDSLGNFGVASSKRFYIFNPQVKDTLQKALANADMLSSEFSVISVEEADEMFAFVKYIATSKEIDQYDNLDNVNAKREFLYQFWKKRDTDLSTPENEFKAEYMERVRKANEKYGTINRKGMKTDRGRVLILYGEPDEIDRYPSDVDKKPYEIWQYNQIEGGVLFVFGDVSGFSDYELLHSTKRGELRDDNWSRRIQSN